MNFKFLLLLCVLLFISYFHNAVSGNKIQLPEWKGTSRSISTQSPASIFKRDHDRKTTKKLDKMKRKVLLDLLISQMSNNSSDEIMDLTEYGMKEFRRSEKVKKGKKMYKKDKKGDLVSDELADVMLRSVQKLVLKEKDTKHLERPPIKGHHQRGHAEAGTFKVLYKKKKENEKKSENTKANDSKHDDEKSKREANGTTSKNDHEEQENRKGVAKARNEDEENGKPEPLRNKERNSKGAKNELRNAYEDKKKKPKKHEELDMRILSAYSLRAQLECILDKAKRTNFTIEKIGRTIEYNDILLIKATETNDGSCEDSGDERKANSRSKVEKVEKVDKDGRRLKKRKKKKKAQNIFANDAPQKPIVFIVHGLSVMGLNNLNCLVSVDQFKLLLQNYIEHLDKFDIFLMPMANPDGLMYSYHNVYWNKNLSPQEACPGVSLDRNFDVAWKERAEVNSCSQQYPGQHSFSEPETKAIKEIFHQYGHKIIAYINVHASSYNTEVFKGDAILYPKGFTDSTVDDDKYIDLRGEIEEGMRNASFKVMAVTVDTLYNWYGKISGSSVDYASHVYGIPYALEFVMQLYDQNTVMAAQTEIWHRLIDLILRFIHKKEKEHLPNSFGRKFNSEETLITNGTNTEGNSTKTDTGKPNKT